jgi:class 3 adenylate cyclase
MSAFQEVKRVLLAVDLAGFTRAMSELDALGVAAFLDGYYALVAAAVTQRGGRVVTLMGDAVLAVFDEEAAVSAVECAIAVEAEYGRTGAAERHGTSVGANIHLATVAEGAFAADGRLDIVGAGVNHVFRMGGGSGVRISEPVYRKLPNERRAAWDKSKPPATYRFDPQERS